MRGPEPGDAGDGERDERDRERNRAAQPARAFARLGPRNSLSVMGNAPFQPSGLGRAEGRSGSNMDAACHDRRRGSLGRALAFVLIATTLNAVFDLNLIGQFAAKG